MKKQVCRKSGKGGELGKREQFLMGWRLKTEAQAPLPFHLPFHTFHQDTTGTIHNRDAPLSKKTTPLPPCVARNVVKEYSNPKFWCSLNRRRCTELDITRPYNY
jgi:hypothetical protein